MNLKYVTEFGDILTAYVLGCLEERMHFAWRYMSRQGAYIIYPIEEIQSRLDCSYERCVGIMNDLEARGYVSRKHILDGPDQLTLPRLLKVNRDEERSDL